MAQKRIQELDGLRAIAIVCVVIFHLLDFGLTDFISGNPLLHSVLGILGASGVHLFFVISGFIITSLLYREVTNTGSINLKKFYVRRIFRIVPPLFFYLLIILFLKELQLITISSSGILCSALFITNIAEAVNLINSISSWFIAHTWSLSVEEQYYIFFPPFLTYFLKFKKIKCSIFVLIFFVFSLLSLKISNYSEKLRIIAIFYQFRFIAAGVLLAINYNVLHAFTSKSYLTPLLAALFIIIIPVTIHNNIVLFLFSGMEPFLFCLLVAWVIENSAKCTFLRSKIIQWIGLSSYSIYLWQQLFLAPESLYKYPFENLLYSIILLLASSSISYYFIEGPSIKLGRNVVKQV